ncbi:MAG: hypothetical protein LBE22_10480 [Azoarcus sp.]|jgi:hypothetical protein|nr:hypothetical protein [Azoarcus sp.]
MLDLTVEQRIENLEAREAAMRAVLLSLIGSHHDKKALLYVLEKIQPLLEVRHLNAQVSDAVVFGAEEALSLYTGTLRKYLQQGEAG